MGRTVVFVSGADPTEGIGGHSSYVRAHGRAARQAGFAPHIFCFSARPGAVSTDYGTVERVAPLSGIDHLPGFRFRRHQAVWRLPRLARAVHRFARALPPPVVIHGFGFWGYVGVAAAARLRRDGIGVSSVVNAYDTLVREGEGKLRGLGAAHGRWRRLEFAGELWWNRLMVNRYEGRGYLGADRLLVNYHTVADDLRQRFGAGHARRVAYAPETAFLRPGGTGRPLRGIGEAPGIVVVSRHDPRKGLDVLLRALGRLRERARPVRATFVGGGPLLGAHRALARTLGLEGRVELVGIVPDVEGYLDGADVLVQPSLEEGSGSVSILEALQTGLAVVASAVDGIPEDVRHEESALLVPPGDVTALASALDRILGDAPLRQRLARAGHATFRSRFSAQALTAAIGNAYADLGLTPDGAGP